jgi:hypothetical protein
MPGFLLVVFVVLPGTTLVVFFVATVGFGATVTATFADVATVGATGTAIGAAAAQSPTGEGTALTPLLMGIRLVPQLAAWARWMFWLSWS